jgi:hypothetical protein
VLILKADASLAEHNHSQQVGIPMLVRQGGAVNGSDKVCNFSRSREPIAAGRPKWPQSGLKETVDNSTECGTELRRFKDRAARCDCSPLLLVPLDRTITDNGRDDTLDLISVVAKIAYVSKDTEVVLNIGAAQEYSWLQERE